MGGVERGVFANLRATRSGWFRARFVLRGIGRRAGVQVQNLALALALALVAAFFTATVLAAAPDAEILAALALAVFFAAVPATVFAPGVPTAVLDAVTFAEPATCDDKDDSFEALAVVAALEVWVAAILVDAMVTQACACSALSAITSSIALRGAILCDKN